MSYYLKHDPGMHTRRACNVALRVFRSWRACREGYSRFVLDCQTMGWSLYGALSSCRDRYLGSENSDFYWILSRCKSPILDCNVDGILRNAGWNSETGRKIRAYSTDLSRIWNQIWERYQELEQEARTKARKARRAGRRKGRR